MIACFAGGEKEAKEDCQLVFGREAFYNNSVYKK